MFMLLNLTAGLRALFRKEAVEREMDEELRSYLEAAKKEKMRSGMSEEEALRAARVEMGSLEAVKEEMRSVGWEARVETLWQDLRYGLRTMRKNPGFTVVAALTLAFGIGANATVFSMVNQILLKPLLYVNPERLLIVWEKPMKEGRREVAAQTYLDWRDRNAAFEQLAAGLSTTLTLAGDPPTFVPGVQVTQNFFDTFRLQPESGRFLIPSEFQPGTQQVAVISHELWQSKLGARSEIIGQPLRLNGESYRVVGVMPVGFEFLGHVDVWTPLVLTREQLNRRFRNLVVVGRLKPGVTSSQAQQEMNGIAARIAQESPQTNQGWGAEVQNIREALLGPGVPFLLLILLMVVGAVLLMACANVANVQLARAAARRQEIAMKMALGAHRFRLVRQLLAESFLVAAFGGAIGLFLAYWVVSYLATLPVMQAPGAARLHMDRAVLAFVAALCVICTIVSGLVPAWQITKSNLLAHIKTASRSTLGEAGQTRFNNSLVIGEFALSFVLLVIAVMGTRSFLNMANTDPGFSAQGILTSHISLPVPRYAGPDRARDFFSRLLAKTETLPGVEAAAISTGIPPHAQTNVRAVRVEGRQPESPSGQMVSYQVASPGYFRLLAATPLEGRTFTSADQQDTPRVVVINRRLAEMFFPNERPLGKRLLIPISVPGRADLADAVPYEIVGVVRDSKNPSPAEPALPEVYLSYLQAPWTSEYLVVRSRVDTAPLTAALRAVLREIDPDQPLTEVQTMPGRYRDALAGVRLSTTLLGVFAAIALLLGNIGLYGIVSYSVSQRTSEFALRMALGAKRHEVFRLVRNRALRLLLMGGAIGLPLALCVSLLVRASLYGISPVSPITFSLVALIHVMVTLTASFLPARRATKIDLMVALRYE